jgi:hypothetical protein
MRILPVDRTTFPLISTSLDVSNIAMLWWAIKGVAKKAVAASPAIAAGRRLMQNLRAVTNGDDIAEGS